MTADGRQVIGTLPEHRISVCERKNLSVERAEVWFTEDYEGDVFCAEVPTYHTLVTRREGKILISGNCTANAIAAALEFDQMKENLTPIFVPSRLFIYYNERAMEGTTSSDSGAQIRDGIKTVSAQGACTESEWPYDITKFAVQPPANCYQDGPQNRALAYQRVSHSLDLMRSCLASGFPFVFGMTVYESFESPAVAQSGQVPMPAPNEQSVGGHAVLAVGYDDAQQVFLVRNSWGSSWGMQGYFSLPYAYLSNSNLTDDLWTIRMVQ